MKTGRLLWNGLLDFIYPPHCLVCDAFGHPAVCPACFAGFSLLPDPVCAICGRPVSVQNNGTEAVSLPCRYCADAEKAGGWGFDRAFVSGAYLGSLRHAIHQLKFNRRELLGSPLGEYLASRCLVDALIPKEELARISLIAAVPLHASRERERGFNQARLLARPVAEMHGVPLANANVLRRVRRTRPQVGLSGGDRMANMESGVFAAASDVRGHGVLLIDDVMTTGATVSACARALKEAGASPVFVAALAAGA